MTSSCNRIVLLSLTQGNCPLIKSNLISYRKITNSESREERMESSGCSWVSQVRELLSKKVMQGFLKDTHTHTYTLTLWMRQHWNCCTQTALMFSQCWLGKGAASRESPAKNWDVCPFPLPFPCLKGPEELAIAEEQTRLYQPCWVKGKIGDWN